MSPKGPYVYGQFRDRDIAIVVQSTFSAGHFDLESGVFLNGYIPKWSPLLPSEVFSVGSTAKVGTNGGLTGLSVEASVRLFQTSSFNVSVKGVAGVVKQAGDTALKSTEGWIRLEIQH